MLASASFPSPPLPPPGLHGPSWTSWTVRESPRSSLHMSQHQEICSEKAAWGSRRHSFARPLGSNTSILAGCVSLGCRLTPLSPGPTRTMPGGGREALPLSRRPPQCSRAYPAEAVTAPPEGPTPLPAPIPAQTAFTWQTLFSQEKQEQMYLLGRKGPTDNMANTCGQ